MYEITLEGINESVAEDLSGFVDRCEKAYYDSLISVSDRINKSDGRKLVMLAGPSSSGKTTTAGLIEKLVNESGKGRKAITVSLDDFYLDQENAPRFEDGSPDFETVHALDISLITEKLRNLIETGEEILPIFDFNTRRARESGRKVSIGENDVVIVEGLHALNPIITEPLENEDILKLYVSVSSRIFNGDDIFFTKRDIRFIRRMIRDYQFRNSPVEFTFYLWKGVRLGEDRYLFPFRNRADIKIDSVHPYELCVYKNTAMDLLGHIENDSDYYQAALELKQKLSQLVSVDEKVVPEFSLLHEFLG